MVDNYREIIEQKQRLETKRLFLRTFTLGDEEAVFAYGSDPRTLKYLIWEGIKDIDGAKRAITQYYSKPLVYALALKDSDLCIGCIDIRLEVLHDKASFGYVLNRTYWGQGYMTEALGAMLTYCFKVLALNRVEATHFSGNEGSGKVMEKCGMIKEGVSPKQVKIKGVFQDVVHYGVLREYFQL